ncbi:hypothetical protein V5H98_16380 [Georgenia sp. M64]|uniref:hypothetical protein n=1 Tax=Georgenia sp. M64 TaxID=3120520 RepID=UPI0030E0A544
MSTPQRSWAALVLLPATAGLFGGTLAWAVDHDPSGAAPLPTTISPAGSLPAGESGVAEPVTGAVVGPGAADEDLAELAGRISEARERIETLRATLEDRPVAPALPAARTGDGTAPAAGTDTVPPVDATTGAS